MRLWPRHKRGLFRLFQLTHLLRGATDAALELQAKYEISTHAPLARCDTGSGKLIISTDAFQLTHLLRGATTARWDSPGWRRFQLTHLLRGATGVQCPTRQGGGFQLTHLLRGATYTWDALARQYEISTHAPLARCDSASCFPFLPGSISTHAPLARCDGQCRHCPYVAFQFQLTHLLRGATAGTPRGGNRTTISTHAPLARCDDKRLTREKCAKISTHAPLARCDVGLQGLIYTPILFQLTHLLRGATCFGSDAQQAADISTHAPLARCDSALA